MTGLSHSVTGSLIGKLLPLPLALPVAFVSHFALDALPHFGEVFEKRKRLSKTVWAIDISLTIVFLIILMGRAEWNMLLAAIVALSPDFAWVYRFIVQERFGRLPPRPANRFNTWHAKIQRHESRPGLAFELAWITGVIIIISVV